jgi:hypothetical protein
VTEVFDFFGIGLLYGSIPVAICISVMSYFRMEGTIRRRSGAAVCFFLATLIFMAFSGFFILLRDGIHPDGTMPTGMRGLLKALLGIGFAGLIAGFFAALGRYIKTNRAPSSAHR